MHEKGVAKSLLDNPFLFGGASWTRTNDPIDVNDVLYRLSHGTMSLDDMSYIITFAVLCQPLQADFLKFSTAQRSG